MLPQPLIDRRLAMCTLFTVPSLWLIAECSAASATNLEWFVTQFCHERYRRRRGVSIYEICNEIVTPHFRRAAQTSSFIPSPFRI